MLRSRSMTAPMVVLMMALEGMASFLFFGAAMRSAGVSNDRSNRST